MKMIRHLLSRLRDWRETRHLRICPHCFHVLDERQGQMSREDRSGFRGML